MENTKQPLLPPRQMISFGTPLRKNTSRFMCFLLCVGILTAAFALSGVWKAGEGWFGGNGALEPQDPIPDAQHTQPSDQPLGQSPSDSQSIPEGAIPVISMDLSCEWNSNDFLQNQTAHKIEVSEIRSASFVAPKKEEGPLVLILHTHATEAYLEPNTSYLTDSVGNVIYSNDKDRSVTSVGEALCDTLNEHGISAVHCAEKHGKDGTLQNAYAGSEACIKAYLEEYPSIQYVIDVHRDGILNGEGALVRTKTEKDGASYGQVMAVVGSDGNGTSNPNWRSNLSLAVKLCEELNERVENISRPISLRNASYNQELASRSLLLEIGSAGNTQEEAIRTAELIGVALSDLIKNESS